MAQSLIRALALVSALAVADAAAALQGAELPDPTRPPSTAAGEPGEPRRPVVQSIIIKGASRTAIIDGERVELNGKFRDAQVARITESEVVLRSAGGVETLKMYPDVEKTVRRAEPPRSRTEPRRSRTAAGEKR